MAASQSLGIQFMTSKWHNFYHALAIPFTAEFDSCKADAIRGHRDKYLDPEPHTCVWDHNILDGIHAWHKDPNQQQCIFATPEQLQIDPGPFHPALLRNEDDILYVGLEFMHRKIAQYNIATYEFAGEQVEFEIVKYRCAFLMNERDSEFSINFRHNISKITYKLTHIKLGDSRAMVWEPNHLTYLDIPLPCERKEVSCIAHAGKVHDEDGDTYFEELRLYLSGGQLPARCTPGSEAHRSFLLCAQCYMWHDARLWHLSIKEQPQLVITDKKRRTEIVEQAHNLCRHRGCDSTYKKLADRYYWPNLYDDVAWFIRSCNACQYRVKSRPIVPLHITISPSILRRFVFDTINMPTGIHGEKFLIHSSDNVSRWPEAHAVKRNNSKTWAHFIFEDIICRFGCIPICVCNGGAEFKDAVHAIFDKYGIAVIISTPYHPQGNGIAERDGQTLSQAIMRS
ncbi:polyprotein [Sparassis crispa]|uniref:Polyprotein n=1 Tax=Sparassis crispa TaxID=139825 RepID=A0A401H644_9APHY|nr:polyprotein [Sparassis crispa]GBE89882.1 polyprotein [Sparassis crispa]